MKAKASFYITDGEENERLRDLGLPEQEEELLTTDFYFDVSQLFGAYINHEKKIIIYNKAGESWVLEYREELWERIKRHLT